MIHKLARFAASMSTRSRASRSSSYVTASCISGSGLRGHMSRPSRQLIGSLGPIIAPTKIAVSGQQSSVGRVEAPASHSRGGLGSQQASPPPRTDR